MKRVHRWTLGVAMGMLEIACAGGAAKPVETISPPAAPDSAAEPDAYRDGGTAPLRPEDASTVAHDDLAADAGKQAGDAHESTALTSCQWVDAHHPTMRPFLKAARRQAVAGVPAYELATWEPAIQCCSLSEHDALCRWWDGKASRDHAVGYANSRFVIGLSADAPEPWFRAIIDADVHVSMRRTRSPRERSDTVTVSTAPHAFELSTRPGTCPIPCSGHYCREPKVFEAICESVGRYRFVDGVVAREKDSALKTAK